MTIENIGVAGDLVVGADNIARAIGFTPRQVFHLASKSELPGCFKLGGKLTLSRAAYQAGLAAKIAAAAPRPLAA